MGKRILLGSIIAVVILTMVSFSSVVGYTGVKSDSKIVSPLFGIRSNRAINKNQDDINSDYIGKGKSLNILLPSRNDKAELVEKLLVRINEMDDSEIDNLLRMVNMKLPKKMNKFFNKEKLTTLLHGLNSDPNQFNELKSHVNVFKKGDQPIAYTMGEPWYPGCFVEFISAVITTIILGIAGFLWFLWVFTHPTVYLYTCDPCPDMI